MARILIIAADGTAIDHLDYAYFRMLEEGFDVTIAAPRKGVVKSSVHWGGPDTFLYYIERPGYILPAHATFDEVDPSQYDGIMLPGGRAPEYLRTDEKCLALVRHFIENDKPIASCCHGPMILLAAGISDRKFCCADDVSSDVEATGNTYVENKGEIPGTVDYIVDGNMVTARGYWHYNSWVREFLNILEARGIARPNKPTAPKRRILVIGGEHSSAGQLSYGYERMIEAGHDVVLAAPKPGPVKTIVDVREEGWDLSVETPGPYLFESLGFEIWPETTIDQVDPSSFDAVLVSGGRGMEYLRNMAPYKAAVSHFLEAGKPIGAICQGTRLLLTAGATGRKLTGLDIIKPEVELKNTYIDTPGKAVIDGNIATVSARPYYHVWTTAFMSLLG